jgi:hypothetical protein
MAEKSCYEFTSPGRVEKVSEQHKSRPRYQENEEPGLAPGFFCLYLLT